MFLIINMPKCIIFNKLFISIFIFNFFSLFLAQHASEKAIKVECKKISDEAYNQQLAEWKVKNERSLSKVDPYQLSSENGIKDRKHCSKNIKKENKAEQTKTMNNCVQETSI